MGFRTYTRTWAFTLVLAGIGCGSSSGGSGELNSEAALQNFMHAIAADFAKVLAEVAPSDAVLTQKGGGSSNIADCPEGGSATYVPNDLGFGTLNLSECGMRRFAVSGSLEGFLSTEGGGLTASGLNGDITVSGAASASLTVQDLSISASPPLQDSSTFWQIRALTMEGMSLCAWSGGPGCGPPPM